jgi:catechol 2,3-dioxygenase-like lactoylglutathione lyase family enzyme
MALSLLDHCSIRTVKLEETRDFYVDVLGMADGDWPNFDFPGNWLYLDGKAVVHLVGVDPDDPSGLEAYLGGSIDAADLHGSGAFDHLAFRGSDAGAMIERLKKQGVPFCERQVPNMELFQIFVTDPNGITVELNYFGEKRAAA